MNIKVIGTGSKNGNHLVKSVKKAIEELGVKINFEIVDTKCNKYGINNYPGLVINEQVITQGKVLPVREIKKLILLGSR